MSSFSSLDQLIDSFAGVLPPVHTMNSTSRAHISVLIHTITYTSTIQLHSILANTDARSSTKSLATAQAAIGLLSTIDALREHDDVAQFPVLNPTFAVLWGIVGGVFVKEVKRLRGLRSASVRNQVREVDGMLSSLMMTMQALSGHSPLMGELFF